MDGDTQENDKTTTEGVKSKGDKAQEEMSESLEKSTGKGNGGKGAQPPRGKGYQEARRYDRDRRDNWRKNERKGADESRGDGKQPSEPSKVEDSDKKLGASLKKDQDRQAEKREGKRDSSDKYSSRSGKPDDRSQSSRTPQKGKDDRHDSGNKGGRKNDRGSRKDSDLDKRRSDDSSDRPNGKGKSAKQENKFEVKSGADLLNLLQSKDNKSAEKEKGKGKGKDVKKKGNSALDLEAQWQKEEDEKRRKEEEEQKRIDEEKRKEAERIRLEEEAKRKEEEEKQRIEQEEIKFIEDYISEAAERIQTKKQLFESNSEASANRPDDSFFGKLDSSLKKNTAFVKKVRGLTDSQKEYLCKDLKSLNLTKYIGEVAQAVTESKLKMSDITCALHVCSLLYQRYAEFPVTLLENWQKVLLNKKDEKVPNPSKLRVDLRFFADLVAIGVFTQKEGLPILASQLQLLTANDKEEHNNLSILLSFCRHCGDDYAGLVSRKAQDLAEKYQKEIPRSTVLPKERQKACRNLLKDYYASLTKHLTRSHKDLKNMEKQNWKTLQTKGELSTERKEKYETALQAYQKLHSNTSTFCDILEEQMPDLPEEEFKSDPESIGLDIYSPMKGSDCQYDGDTSLWEDDDIRQFYESLPDLKAIIPGILYRDSEQTQNDVQESAEQTEAADEKLDELNVEELERVLQEALDKEQAESKDESEPKVDTQTKAKCGKAEEDDLEVEDMEVLPPEIEEDDTDVGGSMKVMLETFLSNLPNCVNRELIDSGAVEFCMKLNTKVNRRKLVRTLFSVHRTRYDLLPFYARLVANLNPCMPDVAADLIQFLKQDFKWHVRKKDQINIESKLKTMRFIGELVKFKIFPKTDALHCLKTLMFDFRHHNIEMACALLDTCGRFLYRSPDSHHPTKVYLDVMMRKKAALHLDVRYTTMIENAYYYSNPPDVKQEAKKVRPPMHEYIRKLLYKDLSKITTEKVLRQIRKLDWDDIEITNYATKCLTAIWNIRYNTVHCCANLLAGLAPYHEGVAIRVVDGVLEDIRVGMETNLPKYNQRRISAVKYLGELYNYRMVESSVVFKTLYSFITFGVTLDDSLPSQLDPPEHLFRIRLVCTLLDTCGQYFDRGSSKKKLDCFLVYFLRYFWFKKRNVIWKDECPFPMDIEYLTRDTLDNLRPKLKHPRSFEEACEAAEELDKEFRAKLAEVLPKLIEEGDTEEEMGGDGTLASIQETDEMEELSQGLSQVQVASGTQESEDDDRTGSQSQSQREEGEDADDDEGPERSRHRHKSDESDEDDILESGDDGDDQEVHVLTGGPKLIQCPEDDDFMTAFDKMIVENIQARQNESVKVPQVDIAVPMQMKGQQRPKLTAIPNVNILGRSPDNSPTTSQPDPPEPELPEPENNMQFTLLTKRGNKQQYSILNVPLTAEFATKFRERSEAEKMEKERMKRMVLDIHERQEEEDYQEMIASMSRPATVNVNRERKVKYQHPKGAPDAALIFGSK